MDKIVASIVCILLLGGCKEFGEKSLSPKEERLIKAKEILQLINEKNYEEILFSFPLEIRNDIPEEVLNTTIDIGNALVKEYGISKDEFITDSLFLQPTQHGDTLAITLIDFPFPQPKNQLELPKYSIAIGFMEKFGEKEIVLIKVRQYEMITLVNPLKIPILSKFADLDAKKVLAYSVHYSGGKHNNKRFGPNKRIFALEGRKTEFRKSKFQSFTLDLFSTLQQVTLPVPTIFEKKSIQPLADSEYMKIDYVLKDSKYDLQFYAPFTNEKNRADPTSEKIIIRQMQYAGLGFEYVLEQKKYPKLLQLFQSIRDHNWGEEYVDKPYLVKSF